MIVGKRSPHAIGYAACDYLSCLCTVPESDGENPEEIPDEEEDEDTYICSTNCRSYRSICRMVQDTLGIEQVSYAGRCDREECSGGPVSAVLSCRQSCYSVVHVVGWGVNTVQGEAEDFMKLHPA